MKAEIWLRIQGKEHRYGSKPYLGDVTATKKKPSITKKDEITIKLLLDIPDSIFIKPELQAKISIAENDISKAIITADVQDNIAEILSEQTGLNINVSYPEEENS